jgi:hypothetical protein
MKPENENLREALRLAQESMDRCEVFYGESNDDSCRNIYARIREMLSEQRQLVESEIESHRIAGEWEE